MSGFAARSVVRAHLFEGFGVGLDQAFMFFWAAVESPVEEGREVSTSRPVDGPVFAGFVVFRLEFELVRLHALL